MLVDMLNNMGNSIAKVRIGKLFNRVNINMNLLFLIDLIIS